MQSFKQFLVEASFKEQIKHHLWKDYKEDAFMPAHESSWHKLSADDKKMFYGHAKDILDHARKHKITDAAEAVRHHTEHASRAIEKAHGIDRAAIRDKIVKKIKSGSGIKQDIAGKGYFPTITKKHH